MSIDHAYWRFNDLKARNIVNNRMTLWRWVKYHGFPPGILLGPNTRAWLATDILDWITSRKSGQGGE